MSDQLNTRLYAETPCEHGRTQPHPLPLDSEPDAWYGHCSEGVRREVTEDVRVAFEAWQQLMASIDITTADDFAAALGAESVIRFVFTKILDVDAALGVSTEEAL